MEQEQGGKAIGKKALAILIAAAAVLLAAAVAFVAPRKSGSGGAGDASEAEESAMDEEAYEVAEAPDEPDAESSAAQAQGAAASLPLTADRLTWLVEPTYSFDDVQPVWAEDFSDVAGTEAGAFSDGKDAFIHQAEQDIFSEMSFPQYSCLPEYYLVKSGDQLQLFFMPSKESSGDLVYALENGENGGGGYPYLYDSCTLLWDYMNLEAHYPLDPDKAQWAINPWDVPYPWNVVGTAERGGGTAMLVYEDSSQQVYFVWDYSGPGDVIPLTDLQLHKPYPIRKGTIQQETIDGYDYRYAELAEDDYAFAAPDGTLLTDFLYEDTGTFSDGIAAVCKDGKWGYIDDTGREVTEFLYDSVWPGRSEWSGGPLAYPCTSDTIVVSRDGRMGVLYRDGSLLIDFGVFEDLAPAWNDQLWAKQDGLWGLIDLADAKAKAGRPAWEIAQAYDP